MNLQWIDWTIILGMGTFLILSALTTRKYMRSTTDYLVANRCAGRYLLTFSSGVAGIGALSIVTTWQIQYKTGFGAGWWSHIGTPLSAILLLGGWIIYRYRETRVLTLAQFFEVRYSRNFRLLAGTICWVSGLITFGIFPSVGANFFINYCGFPTHFQLAGITFSTYHTLIIGLVGISLYFTFIGGQISVIVTDYIQSFFCNIVGVTLLIILLYKFPLTDVFEGLLIAEEGKSMINPLDAGKADFSPWYFLIGTIALIFHSQAGVTSAGSQAYNVSARTPHEAKMASILISFRGWGFSFGMILVPLVAYMIMHHPDYALQADQVTQSLSQIENAEVRDQMIVPMTLTLYMPVGMMGAFAAMMFAAFITTHDTQLHSWGSILIQDIILPLKKKPFTTKQHFLALRLSTIFVAVYICVFSFYFRHTQHLAYFTAVTAAIWLGGIGTVMIGGLYTNWGSTAAAYAALITGSVLAGGGLVLDQLWMSWYGINLQLPTQCVYILLLVMGAVAAIIVGRLAGLKWGPNPGIWAAIVGLGVTGIVMFMIESNTPQWGLFNVPWPKLRLTMNGMWIFFFAMMLSMEIYLILSLSRKPKRFNLDKMLHRGKYQIESEHVNSEAAQSIHESKFSIGRICGFTKDFTIGDKVIYGVLYSKYMMVFTFFVVVSALALIKGLSDNEWAFYHRCLLSFWIFSSFIIAIWLTIGGLYDLVRMYKDLRTAKRDFDDDGRVVDHDYEERNDSVNNNSSSS